MNINEFGFLRVGAASPKVRVADCDYNTEEIKKVIDTACDKGVQILTFPELSITSYSCGDLFHQDRLIEKSSEKLLELSEYVKSKKDFVAIVGLPIRIENNLYNVAAVLGSEGIMGFVPKTYIPNHREFQEKRWFSSANDLDDIKHLTIGDEYAVMFHKGMIFETPFANFGIEICEDLWVRTPPSSSGALQNSDIIFNLSASNELVGKNSYRRSLIMQQSARCNVGYVYASAGVGESTTDVVFSGACFIAENGRIIAEGKRFSLDSELTIADIDVQALRHDKLINTNYNSHVSEALSVEVNIGAISTDKMYHDFDAHPFIPKGEGKDENLSELFNIQTHGLAKRLEHTKTDKAVIGISGGLDSTLALLVTIKTFDLLGLPRKNIIGITMPGFGTTGRTYNNALKMMQAEGITIREISIVESVKQHFKDIGHDIETKDITYENSQARERTQILMDVANMANGLVIGTGNMSELALGWATYNGDHMSMYAVNSSVPKTLVKTLVRWIADNQMEGEAKETIYDVLNTPYSPELLPADKDGNIEQKTEASVGPYELTDFFLHRMLRYGDSPRRILFIAERAFEGEYEREEILKWLKKFYWRFFSQQFKRSCMPDGPKAGSVNLSPRGSWRMPSDAMVNTWMEELE
ncbi:MAG: NAD(+) synthase [Fermentimonas sp.]|jgi:NAD+ synthase (glutamine-hydrolysing)